MLNDDIVGQIPLFEAMETKEKEKPAKEVKPANAKKKAVTLNKNETEGGRKTDTISAVNEGRKRRGDKLKRVAMDNPLSGKVPEGDVRLTANIRQDLHLKLKIAAARRRTTIGELLEEMVEKYI